MTISASKYTKHLQRLLCFYDELLSAQGYAGLVIPSGIPKRKFLDDSDYNFTVNVHFKALLPVIDAPHSYIIYIPGAKPVLAFYQPNDYWHVVPSDPEGDWVESFDIKILTGKEDWQKLLPESRKNLVWLGESQSELTALKIEILNPQRLLDPIHYNRACKSDYEISCLRQANHKAAKGHLAAKDAFYGGACEFEIHFAYLQASGQTEQQLPYGNIVALNKHGAVLHYSNFDTLQQPPSKSHSFLIDAGATHKGYFSDITRTWAFREGEFKDLISLFDQLQQDIISELEVGKSYVDLHIMANLKISQLLRQVEFIYCDAETAVETGISSTFFAHGLGHLLGLQVHDIGGHQASADGATLAPPDEYPFLRLTRKLQAGFCITIEPGLYFIDLLLDKLATSKHAHLVNWTKVEAFKKYGGIRIEDDIIMTNTGVENLTRDAFAKLIQ